MTLKIAQFVQILLFCVLAGQAFFYLMGGTAGLKNVSASTFIEQRKAIDMVIGPFLKVIYPGSILIGIVVLVLLRQQATSLLFILSALALLLVVVDLVIAINGNIPLNNQIQTWSPTQYPANWSALRHQWFGYMQWRQACSISGLFCLLLGLFSRL